ncbi:MAG: hypothetical protein AABY66_06595, partial [Nitrospirota bacterium]
LNSATQFTTDRHSNPAVSKVGFYVIEDEITIGLSPSIFVNMPVFPSLPDLIFRFTQYRYFGLFNT